MKRKALYASMIASSLLLLIWYVQGLVFRHAIDRRYDFFIGVALALLTVVFACAGLAVSLRERKSSEQQAGGWLFVVSCAALTLAGLFMVLLLLAALVGLLWQ